MNKRLFFLVLIIIMILFFLTGCWNYRELDRLAIVSGVAVDKSEKGDKFLLTTEVIDVKPGATEVKISSIRIDSEGDTIFDAMRNMIKISGKKLYWSHAKIIILSQDVAKESIIPIVDWISRDQEPRLTLYILVSKEKTAKEILSQQSVTTDIRSFEINNMISANNSLSKAPEIEVYEVINDIASDGIYPALPAIGIAFNDGKSTSELSGTAVFKKDKLIGFLDGEQTKYYLFVRDKIKGGILVVKMPEEGSSKGIALEIFKNKTKVKPIYSNGKFIIKVDIKTEVTIGEEDTSIDYISENGRDKLKAYAEKSLEKHVEDVIKKVQHDFDSDVFGFGKIVKSEMPSLWKEIKNDWNDIFKELEVEVNAKIQIRNSGFTISPVKVGR